MWREENWRTRRKTLGARRQPTTNSTHIWHRAGIEAGPYWWEASVLATAPCLLFKSLTILVYILGVGLALYAHYLFLQVVKNMCHFSCTGTNLAVLDGGITPLPLATVPQLSRLHEESTRFDFVHFFNSLKDLILLRDKVSFAKLNAL